MADISEKELQQDAIETQNKTETQNVTEKQNEIELQPEAERGPLPKVEYDKERNVLFLRPGASAREVEALELKSGCSVIFDNNETGIKENFEISGDLLRAIGDKAQHVGIEKDLVFAYLSPQEGDIWSNLSELRTLRIKNNVGVPTNIDGTGAFQNHPTLRSVEMQLSAEGQLSDNFCRGTSVSSFMVHSSKPGKEYGLKAGDNVLFGSLVESAKGISTADWNELHKNHICKTHKDDSYLSELSRFDIALNDAGRFLDGNIGNFLGALSSRQELVPLFQHAVDRAYSVTGAMELNSRGLSEEDYARLVPTVKTILNELKDELKTDFIGTCLDNSYCMPFVEKVLQDCNKQAQQDFKDAYTEAKFRKSAYQSEIDRDEALKANLQDVWQHNIDALKQITKYGTESSTEAKRITELFDKVLAVAPRENANEKEYADALKEISEITGKSKAIEDKEGAKSSIRGISDAYGLLCSTNKRIAALETLKNTHKRKNGAYIELPSRISAGDNFLSCRETELHSATDPGLRQFKEELEAFNKKTVNAIYASCVEYKETFWKTGLMSVINDQGGVVDGKTYEDFVKEKDPIAEYNKVAKPEARVNKEPLTTRGTEERLSTFNSNDQKQIEKVFDFVLDTAKSPPKDYARSAKDMDRQICEIVQGGDIGHEELRNILPSMDFTSDGHVLDFKQTERMQNVKNIFTLGEGSKLGDNCLCFINCNGVHVGHNTNEYRHFKIWAESQYQNAKNIIAPMMKDRLGIVMGSDKDKDAKEPGALRDDIKSNIVALENEMKKAPSLADAKGKAEKGKKTKEDYLVELQAWKNFQAQYESYTNDRLVWESNDTEEKWLARNSYALQDVNERIRKFEEANATTKTKDFKTHTDVYTMNRDALSDDKRAQYDKLIAERDAILVDPQKVATGSHFYSEGKEMGNEKAMLTGGEINAGYDSFSNNPEVLELHKNNPETNITADVMKKNLYDKSDIFRGRLLMAKEALKDIFSNRDFRYMRLEEACLSIIINLFKTLFNLTSWAAKTIEREIRQEKTKRGIYSRNVDEAKEILLASCGNDGEAFLSRLSSKSSPASEYNAVLRVVGRLNLNKILNSNGSSVKKLEQIQNIAQRKLANAKNAEKRANGLNKREQLSKAQLLGFYRQMGTWTREIGMAKTSRRLSLARGRTHSF
jgi:hypothetical protein